MRTLQQQSGAALFTALIFLVIITLASLSAMRSATIELRMAGNAELKNTAHHMAQTIVDSTVANASNTRVLGGVGSTTCFSGCTYNDMDLQGAQFDAAAWTDGNLANGEIDAVVTRLDPLEAPAPRSIGTSAAVYSVATFSVTGDYDMSAVGQGQSQIVEGVMVLISK